MKLLFMLPEYVTDAGGGIIAFYRHFLPLLSRRGHDVRVLVGSGVKAEASKSSRIIDGVHVESLEYERLMGYYARFGHYSALPVLRRHLAASWAMWEQAGRGEGYDVVEAADWGLLFLPWIIEDGPPCVVQLHGSIGQIDVHDPLRGEEVHGQLARLIESIGVSQASVAQAYSHGNAQFWSRRSRRRVDRILPAWQPHDASGSSSVRTSRGLVVGRVQRWKGPEVLCEALELLGTRAPSIDWVGRDTPYEQRNVTTSAHLAMTWPTVWGQRVVQVPQQPGDVTARLQGEAAFVVVPSLWDTFNFTCAEAMGAATPVICSKGAGASELIEDGVSGFVFEIGDSHGLAGALDRLLSVGEAKRRSIGEMGRQVVTDALDPVKRTGERLQAYEAAVLDGPQKALAGDDWLRLACAPGGSGSDSLAFLDQTPLRHLLTYVLQRVRGKYFDKA